VLTEIDCLNAENPQTLGTGFLTILARAINRVACATFDESKLGYEEDFIALLGAFEPFAQELFAVSVETRLKISIFLHQYIINCRSLTLSCPRRHFLAHRPDQEW
jgi:hypothetical protein